MQTFDRTHKTQGQILRKISAPSYCRGCDSQRSFVRHILRSVGAQAKLTVGAPDDVYEQEADRVADEVMRMPEPHLQATPTCKAAACPQAEEETFQSEPLSDQITPLVQRQCEEEEEKELIQTKALNGATDLALQRQPEEEEEELLQTKEVVGHTPEATPRVASAIASMQDGGRLLPASERAFFEPRFGQDFSQVRIHTGAQATEAARSVNAQAFTLGNDIYFNQGKYNPQTPLGKHLLTHELVHVLQQKNRMQTIMRSGLGFGLGLSGCTRTLPPEECKHPTGYSIGPESEALMD